MQARETQQAITGYARAIVDAWMEDGRPAVDLAEKAGVSGAFVSQLRTGDSGLGLTGTIGFATALGLSLGELQDRAQDWHRAGRPALGPEALPPREKRR